MTLNIIIQLNLLFHKDSEKNLKKKKLICNFNQFRYFKFNAKTDL